MDHKKPQHLQNRDMEVSPLEEHGHKGRLLSPLQTRFMRARLLAFILKTKTQPWWMPQLEPQPIHQNRLQVQSLVRVLMGGNRRIFFFLSLSLPLSKNKSSREDKKIQINSDLFWSYIFDYILKQSALNYYAISEKCNS